ncbi:hypothetical protein PFZ55_32580 [Streptomyces sp. MS2A]|uniref:hypothetical protein n=1 Tax=Streptomyces sp. NPDC057387 TaxID=3346115 RepID=UPI0022F04BD5|nr:hypothetical protein [Streptomyces sp. MS2A]
MSRDRNGRTASRRRSALTGAAGTAALPVAAVVLAGVEAALPWWAIAGPAALTAGLAGWAGVRISRRRAVRREALEPGEKVLGTYTVRPPYREHTPPAAHEGPQYQLVVTSRGLHLWERSALLWRHPWPELRVLVDGPRLRVHHEGREAGHMLLEPPGAAQEVRRVAARHAAG